MVIEELDEKKKETLKVTWTKVNKWVYCIMLDYMVLFIDTKINHLFGYWSLIL